MMIMRFHKLIQSRLLWLVFLGVLICSFVLWGIVSESGSNPMTQQLNRTVATIDGEDVSFVKLDKVKNLMLWTMRQRIPDEMLTDLALTHLAEVAYAEKLGLGAPMDLAKQQFSLGFNDAEGNWDEESYQDFKAQISSSRLSEADFVAYTREQITRSNLQRVIASTVLVPGWDVDRWANMDTAEYTVHFAALTPEILEEEVVATEEQVQRYFAENIDRFQLPEQRSVRYLSVKVEDFVDQIKTVTNSDALDYFHANPELYVRSVSKPAEEEGAEPTTVQEQIPYVEVQDQIMEKLKMERARKLAEDTAMSYAVHMTPRRGKPGKSLDSIAAEAGQDVQTTEAFALRDPVPGLSNAAAFKQEAFKLEDSDLGRRGGPVEAGDAFVVMELNEVIPPRPPSFEEVAGEVEMAANAHYTREAVKAKGAELSESIRSAVAAGGSFADELEKAGLNIVSPPPFEMRNMDPRRPMLPPELLEAVTAAKTGDVLGPIDSRFGVSFVAHLEARKPNPEAAAELAPQMRQVLSSKLHFQEASARFRETVIEPMIEKVEPEVVEEENEVEAEDV